MKITILLKIYSNKLTKALPQIKPLIQLILIYSASLEHPSHEMLICI
jgi:hypothetical protein